MNYGWRFVTLYRRQGSRPSPRKRNTKKEKWLSEEALQKAVKRREAKSKGEKKRYTHLNAEFQRTARRDKKAFLSDQCKEIEEYNGMGKTRDLFKKIGDTKGIFHPKWAQEKGGYTHLNAEFQRTARRNEKAFLSDQCKEIEENNRMGKTWDLFKKISDTKGTFQAKMGTIKDRNGIDLTEAEDIKTRWQEYTEELYKKDFMIQITMTV